MRRLPALASAALYTTAMAMAASAAVEDGYVTADDGVRLYYNKVGAAPKVVIQPGRLFAFEDFRWLGEHVTLISYDMRNRGRSDLVADDTKLTLEQDVDDLEAVRRHFGVERFAAMGYSYLGKVIVLYAIEHPQRVERLVQLGPVAATFTTEYRPELVATDDPMDPAGRARLREMRDKGEHLRYPRRYCEEEWKVTRVMLVGDPARLDRLHGSVCAMPNEWPILLARHMRLHFEESSQVHVLPRERIREVTAPVLTVHGTRDRNAPYGAGREWSYLLPNGRLLTVEGAAHQAFAEARETVMPAVGAFLRGEWPKAAVKVTEDPRKP
jgi:proline iminopeptidase